MGGTSKDLLHLEHNDSSASAIESALLVCNKKDSKTELKKPNPNKRPSYEPVPRSQVLGKVKDFLGVISEANKRLQLDAKDNAQYYDMEVLTGNESKVIEMDLMLGIADLHTPEAVSAAESAITGNQSAIPLPASNSETETEDSSDDSDDDYEDNKNDDNDKTNKDDSLSEYVENKKSKKRPKIVVLS